MYKQQNLLVWFGWRRLRSIHRGGKQKLRNETVEIYAERYALNDTLLAIHSKLRKKNFQSERIREVSMNSLWTLHYGRECGTEGTSNGGNRLNIQFEGNDSDFRPESFRI